MHVFRKMRAPRGKIGAMSEDQSQIPPATLEFLILSLKMQAEMSLGLLKMPGEDQEQDLVRARHFIDLLAMLAEKTKGNLSLQEQRLLENTVTELRFRFVQVSPAPTLPVPAQAPAEAPAEAPAQAPAEEPAPDQGQGQE